MNNVLPKTNKATHTIKAEIIALLILIPLAVVLGLVVTHFPTSQNASSSLTPVITPAVSSVPTLRPVQALAVVVPKTARVTLELQAPTFRKTYQVPLAQNQHVSDVLLEAKKQGLALVTKDYGGSLGLFVEAMNGVANSTSTNLYWQFYINGTKSSVGASSASVKANDTITWKYERQDD